MSRRDTDPNRGNRRVPLSTVSAADLMGLNDDEPVTAPTPAVPDLLTRLEQLRDQLAEKAADWWSGRHKTTESDFAQTAPLLDRLFPLIAAHVEALVQAATEELVSSHELMARQFRIMQQEKEHGWREAERWENEAERLQDALREAQS